MAMAYETIRIATDERGVCQLTLARPDVHNAMNKALIGEMRDAVKAIAKDPKVRVVVLSGEGKSFCAGGDLRWMKANADMTREKRIAEAGELADMLHELDTLPKPVIGRINGPAYGGGVGMMAVCDLAIGVSSARFGLTEVRLGLVPATISPYVVRRMGPGNARKVFFSGRLFPAEEARALNLLSAVVAPEALDEAIEKGIAELLQAAPGAVGATKRLVDFVATHDHAANRDYTLAALADAWETEEGQEGIQAFLNKETPWWRKGN